MSYNLYAEGEIDLFELAQVAQRFMTIEVFPIPGEDGEPDAIGIAVPVSRATEDAIDELDEIVGMLLAADARVFDLMIDARIESELDLPPLADRILGR